MKLYELAFTSHVYDSFTNFHTDFMKLCEDTKPSLDMYNPKHRQELINWLNQWGCRSLPLLIMTMPLKSCWIGMRVTMRACSPRINPCGH